MNRKLKGILCSVTEWCSPASSLPPTWHFQAQSSSEKHKWSHTVECGRTHLTHTCNAFFSAIFHLYRPATSCFIMPYVFI